jgi:hypothetical protein
MVKAHDRGRVLALAVADQLANLNNEVFRDIGDESVGPRCIVAWRNKPGGGHKGGGSHKMRVETDPDTGVSAKTVGELRKVTAWPENLAITTPLERDPQSTVKVKKASVATRTSPKP